MMMTTITTTMMAAIVMKMRKREEFVTMPVNMVEFFGTGNIEKLSLNINMQLQGGRCVS